MKKEILNMFNLSDRNHNPERNWFMTENERDRILNDIDMLILLNSDSSSQEEIILRLQSIILTIQNMKQI